MKHFEYTYVRMDSSSVDFLSKLQSKRNAEYLVIMIHHRKAIEGDIKTLWLGNRLTGPKFRRDISGRR